jgi:hypothetical protein
MQAQRDNRPVSGSPSRTNRGAQVRSKERLPGTKKQREFTREDMNAALTLIAQPDAKPASQSIKPRQRSAGSH